MGDRFLFFVLSLLGRVNEKYSLVGKGPYFSKGEFKWIPRLESKCGVIKEELESLFESNAPMPEMHKIAPHQYNISSENQWKVYFLYGYGYKAHKNCDRCPETTRLIEEIPHLRSAYFSILPPGVKLVPHRGPYNGFLRYHLGLLIPLAYKECGLTVGGVTKHWKEGESFIFDDYFIHDAYNNSSELRVVLIVDFDRPLVSWASYMNRAFIGLISKTKYVKIVKENQERIDEYYN